MIFTSHLASLAGAWEIQGANNNVAAFSARGVEHDNLSRLSVAIFDSYFLCRFTGNRLSLSKRLVFSSIGCKPIEILRFLENLYFKDLNKVSVLFTEAFEN